MLEKCAFFAGLTVASQKSLSQALVDKKFAPGQFIFMKGDAPDGMYFIAAGSVDIATSLETGKKISLNRLEANQFFGEIGLFDQNVRTSDAIALSEVHSFKLSRAAFENASLYFNHAEWLSILQKLCALLRTISINLESFVLSDPAARLIKKLLALPRQGAAVPISQSQLAEMVNLSRESTNKMLAQLEKDGLIKTSYGKIYLLDEGRLSTYGRGSGDAI